MRTALITGASSGIGAAIAQNLAKKQFRLILCGRNEARLQKTKSFCESFTEVHSLLFDVADNAEVTQAIHSLPDEWKTISVLINNAGNAHGLAPLEAGHISDWHQMLDSNVAGLLHVSAAVIPFLLSSKNSQIINISSVAARKTYVNGVVYCATKKAVDVISEGMRLELTEKGVRVTNIQPGAVETDFSLVRFKNDADRAAQVYQGYEALQAEDIAEAVSYCLKVPSRVSIAEMCIYPAAQADPTTIFRK